MKRIIYSALATATILFTSSCATTKARDGKAPTGPPSATLTATAKQAAYSVAGGTGSGTISFQGQRRGFTFAAIGAGGTGAQSLEGTGEVYNLDSLADFEGSYTAAKSGITLFKGTMHERLENDKGVVIYITAKTTGLASSTGVSTVTISLD